jgi:negative regulator of flagellin synthesis FlgM
MVDSIGVKPTTIDRRIAPVASPKAVSTSTSVAANGTSNTGADTASVSLAQTASDLAAKPPVDNDRVAEIRKAIQNGTFPIYPAKIADRLIALKLQWNPNESQ